MPDRIEEAIVRALQPDREERWPDVAAFTKELVGGLNETTRSLDPLPAPVVEAAKARKQDRVATVIGTQQPVVDEPTISTSVRRRRAPWIAAALLAAVLGAGGGYLAQRYLADSEMVSVGDSDLSVMVPRSWTKHVSDQDWQPPGTKGTLDAVRATADITSSAPESSSA